MRSADTRDRLHAPADVLEIAVRRIRSAGGRLDVWGVLREDVYETRYGDGHYLHLRALALNPEDAHRLKALAGDGEMTRWSIRPYTLALSNGEPIRLDSWAREEEFTINDFVHILAEIPDGKATSRLMTGAGAEGRRPGPHMLSLD